MNAGAKVLIVEDESLIAMLVEDMLMELGYEVVGVASSLKEGETMVTSKTFDAVLLDVSLQGEKSFPIAEMLEKKGIPFVFSSGFDSTEIGANFSSRPLLRKPFKLSELEEILLSL